MSDQTEANQQTPERARRPRWQRWLRDLLLVVLVVAAVQWWQSRGLVAGTAPPLVGHLIDGRPYQLDPADGPTLVHFWASWCPICRLEEDSIDAIAADYPTMTIATSTGTAKEVGDHLREQVLSMPVLMDENGDVARAWGVRGVPATFIVDRAGRIEHASTGYSSGIGLRLRLWWAAW